MRFLLTYERSPSSSPVGHSPDIFLGSNPRPQRSEKCLLINIRWFSSPSLAPLTPGLSRSYLSRSAPESLWRPHNNWSEFIVTMMAQEAGLVIFYMSVLCNFLADEATKWSKWYRNRFRNVGQIGRWALGFAVGKEPGEIWEIWWALSLPMGIYILKQNDDVGFLSPLVAGGYRTYRFVIPYFVHCLRQTKYIDSSSSQRSQSLTANYSTVQLPNYPTTWPSSNNSFDSSAHKHCCDHFPRWHLSIRRPTTQMKHSNGEGSAWLDMRCYKLCGGLEKDCYPIQKCTL